MLLKNMRFWLKVFSFLIVFLFFYFYPFYQKDKFSQIDYFNKANNILPENVISKQFLSGQQKKQLNTATKKGNNEQIKIQKVKVEKLTYEQLKRLVGRMLNFHGVSIRYNGKLYYKVCNFDIILCKRVHFQNIEVDEKIRYLAIIQFVIRSLDDNLKNTDSSFKKAIKAIYIDGKATRRGYASHHIVYINAGNIKSNKEFLNVLTHELGHIFDLGVLNGRSSRKSIAFTEFGEQVFSIDDPSLDFYKISWISEKVRKGGQTVRDFVSGYGMTDPFEDFAESFNVYMNHYLYFKYLSYNNYSLELKFDFLDKYFEGFHFFDDKKSLDKIKLNPRWRPWDSTIME